MTEGFLERNTIVSAFVPVDMQTANNDGDWVSLAKYDRCLCVLFKGIGTATDDPIFNLQQADSNTGGNAKDINFTVIHKKVGSQLTTLDFSRVTQTAATSHTDAVSAEAEAIMAVEIKADEMDIDNGFVWLRLDIANIGSNAQIGCAFYILIGARYKQPTPPDAQS